MLTRRHAMKADGPISDKLSARTHVVRADGALDAMGSRRVRQSPVSNGPRCAGRAGLNVDRALEGPGGRG